MELSSPRFPLNRLGSGPGTPIRRSSCIRCHRSLWERTCFRSRRKHHNIYELVSQLCNAFVASLYTVQDSLTCARKHPSTTIYISNFAKNEKVRRKHCRVCSLWVRLAQRSLSSASAVTQRVTGAKLSRSASQFCVSLHQTSVLFT